MLSRLLVLLLLTAASASAQAPERLAWVALSSGASSGNTAPGNPAFASVAADAHAVRGLLHVQAGASFQSDFSTSNSVAEAHVSAGLARRVGPVLLTSAAGPSVAYVVRARYGPSVPRFAGQAEGVVPGVHASAGAAVVLWRASVGVEAFGLLNARTPVAGARLTVGLGRF